MKTQIMWFSLGIFILVLLSHCGSTSAYRQPVYYDNQQLEHRIDMLEIRVRDLDMRVSDLEFEKMMNSQKNKKM